MRSIPVFLLCVIGIHAQETPRPTGPPSLRVHGQATVTAQPNQVQFDIGVVAQAASAKAATDQNTTKSSALIQELRKLLLPPANMTSINFSVNPNYRYPAEGAPVIVGYTASNTVRLLLDDTSKLQSVIDIAITSGANSINRLAFTLRNDKPVRAQALAEAATQAQAGAQALAAAMNLKLGRLLSVEEGQPVIVSPPREISFEKLQSTAVSPISPGSIDVHADVNLTYAIVQTNPQ
jgi:uncharacterized protein YggE